MDSNGATLLRNSSRSVRWNRSIFPVVVGGLGLVSRVVMPFSRQTRSNMTSAGSGLVCRPVNCLPLSVRVEAGAP
jgi:hypothetical protein